MNILMRGFFDGILMKYMFGKNKYFKTPITETNYRKKFIHVPESEVLYVNLPGWHAHFSLDYNLRKRIFKKGFSYLGYEFPGGILSPNAELTKKDFLKLSKFVKADIKFYKKNYGFKKIVVIGSSLGVVLSLLVINGNKLVNKFVSIVPGYDLASSLWTGIATKSLRKKFEKQNITLKKLMKFWNTITPMNNIDKLDGKEILVYLSKADRVIDYSEGEKLFNALKRKKYNVSVYINTNLGHYLTYYFAYKKFNFLND